MMHRVEFHCLPLQSSSVWHFMSPQLSLTSYISWSLTLHMARWRFSRPSKVFEKQWFLTELVKITSSPQLSMQWTFAALPFSTMTWARSWRDGEGVGKPEFCLPLLHGKTSFQPPLSLTCSRDEFGCVKLGISALKTRPKHLVGFSQALFLLSEIRKTRAKAAAVTGIVKLPTSHTQLWDLP